MVEQGDFSEFSDFYTLPRNIERYLAALSKLYAQQGKRFHQELVVNAQVRVKEGTSRDNWNGGTYGHTLYLVLPDSLYVAAVHTGDIQNE